MLETMVRNSVIRPELVGFDVDHTLLSWADYYVAAMQECLPRLAETLDLPEVTVGITLGEVFRKYGTHEYPWALCCAFASRWHYVMHRDVDRFRKEVEHPFWETILHSLKRNLTAPYKGVRSTLQAMEAAGILRAAVSNGPYHIVALRLMRTGLDHLVPHVYAIKFPAPDEADTASLPHRDYLKYGHGLVERCIKLATQKGRFQNIVTLSPLEKKPTPVGIQRMLKDLGVLDPSRAWFIGDKYDDILAGRRAGVARIGHAKQGSWKRLSSEVQHMLHVTLGTPRGEKAKEVTDGCPSAEQPDILIQDLNRAAALLEWLELENTDGPAGSGEHEALASN